jgi:hypothetical protein
MLVLDRIQTDNHSERQTKNLKTATMSFVCNRKRNEHFVYRELYTAVKVSMWELI